VAWLSRGPSARAGGRRPVGIREEDVDGPAFLDSGECAACYALPDGFGGDPKGFGGLCDRQPVRAPGVLLHARKGTTKGRGRAGDSGAAWQL
jgi:hypothetical protein